MVCKRGKRLFSLGIVLLCVRVFNLQHKDIRNGEKIKVRHNSS